MVLNEWDDILYWEDYEPYRKLTQELDKKYYQNRRSRLSAPPNPDLIACWRKYMELAFFG